jgi:hypothetical protein
VLSELAGLLLERLHRRRSITAKRIGDGKATVVTEAEQRPRTEKAGSPIARVLTNATRSQREAAAEAVTGRRHSQAESESMLLRWRGD